MIRQHNFSDIPSADGGTYIEVASTALRLAGIIAPGEAPQQAHLQLSFEILDCMLEQGTIVQELAKRLRDAYFPGALESKPDPSDIWMAVFMQCMRFSGNDVKDSALRADTSVEQWRQRFPPYRSGRAIS